MICTSGLGEFLVGTGSRGDHGLRAWLELPIPDFEIVKQPSLLLPLDYSSRGWQRSMDEMDYHYKAITASIDALPAVIKLTLKFLGSL